MGERLTGSENIHGPSAPARRDLSSGTDALRAAICEAAPAVRRFLFAMCCNWHEAEDLTQEALLKAWARRQSFDGRASAGTWIFSIARNHWLDRLRRRSRRAEQSITAARQTEVQTSCPAATLARRELAAAIERALAKLPDEQRQALALRESEGLTFSQIAALLDVPTATVKSRVRYALVKLADELKAFRPELKQ